MDMAEFYHRLNESLRKGDPEFIDEGVRLLRQAYGMGLFDGLAFTPPEQGEYTRHRVMGGGEEELAIRSMAWNGVVTPIHEHHGRPCFDVVLEGILEVEEWEVVPQGDLFKARSKAKGFYREGDVAVLSNANNIHSVKVDGNARSLHIYPHDKMYTFVYKSEGDLFRRERMELHD